jgi:hypothetical protein
MIKTALALAIFLSSAQEMKPNYTNDKASREAETMVYLCNSESARKYHYAKGCRGLGNCKHTIISVSLSDAKYKYGRTLCGWED